MFRTSLCPSSGAQEYYTVVAACGILCCKNQNHIKKVKWLIKVRSCNALLRMLPVCIGIYLKSVLRYRF